MRLAPDPRLILVSTFFCGFFIWKLTFIGLLLLLSYIAFSFYYFPLSQRIESTAIQRFLLFIIIWPLAKTIITLAIPTGQFFAPFLGATGVQSVSIATLQSLTFAACAEAGILFLRLTALVGLALLITCLYSTRTLGAAFAWFLQPIAPKNGWKVALALALMLQYLPAISAVLSDLRQATRIRGIQRKGLSYYTLIIPRALHVLAGRTWQQAIAISSRLLDHPKAWQYTTPLPVPQIFICGLILSSLYASTHI